MYPLSDYEVHVAPVGTPHDFVLLCYCDPKIQVVLSDRTEDGLAILITHHDPGATA